MTRDGILEAVVCGTLTVTILLLIIARDYPLVGHDLRYYVPRLLDTQLHVNENGYLAVQWYTPAFGGGLPAFPNPQHLQHSVLQLLTAVVNPWRAILMTTALAASIGFVAFREFLRRRLAILPTPATFGAVLFVANGFYIEHMIVGHVGYQLFPLSAVMLLALTDPSGRVVRSGAVLALCAAAMLFHAGIYQIILIGLSTVLTLPLLPLVGVPIAMRRVAAIAAVAIALGTAMSASKVHAVLAFMQQFPREIADVYDVSLPVALAGLVLQLTGAMTVAPVMLLVGIDPARLEGALTKLTGASVQVGLWELDTSLSPAVWVVLAVAALGALRQVRVQGWPRLERRDQVALMALVVFAWILIEATLARGLIYPLIKPLPVLRSLHVNHRIASVFIVPLIIIAARVLQGWTQHPRSSRLVMPLLVVAVLSPLAYFLFPARVHQRSFDVSGSVAAYERMGAGERFEVTRILDVSDAEALVAGASSYRPYEPLFGYGLEAFAATTVPGDVRDVRDGAFNLTHPASLVFPRENGLQPFDRIPAGDRGSLDAFVAREGVAWQLPPVQSSLSVLSIAGLVISVIAIGWPRRYARSAINRDE